MKSKSVSTGYASEHDEGGIMVKGYYSRAVGETIA
jgi:hypothetical protein